MLRFKAYAAVKAFTMLFLLLQHNVIKIAIELCGRDMSAGLRLLLRKKIT